MKRDLVWCKNCDKPHWHERPKGKHCLDCKGRVYLVETAMGERFLVMDGTRWCR